MDASGSVTAPNFAKTLTFVENMVNGLVIGPNDTQVGMITFDTKPYLQFHLNKFATKQVSYSNWDMEGGEGGEREGMHLSGEL